MKIITEPTVTVVGVTQFYPHPKYKLPVEGALDFDTQTRKLQGTSCEQLTAMAGKGCYDSYGEDGRNIKDHIQNLISSRHGSVLEHANISLFIEGISRGCSHEIVRHRAGFAFSQRSTRYVDEGDCAIVLDPYYVGVHEFNEDVDFKLREWTSDEQDMILDYREFKEDCRADIRKYAKRVDFLLTKAPSHLADKDKRKWARGKARQRLPHAIETRMTMTGNLRAWRHFIESRSNRFAEAEIRRLSNAVWNNIRLYAPTVFEDYTKELVDGYYEYTTPNTKV